MAAVSKGGLMLRDASQRSRFLLQPPADGCAATLLSMRPRVRVPAYPTCSLSMWASTAGR